MASNNIKIIETILTVSFSVLCVGLLAFFMSKFYYYIKTSSVGSGGFFLKLWGKIQGALVSVMLGMLTMYNFVYKNYFKTGLILFLITYLLVSFFAYPVGPLFKSGSFDFNTPTGNVGLDSRSLYILITNVIWWVLGAALILGVFNTTLKNWNKEYPYPVDESFSKRASWTMNRNKFNLKVLLSFVIIFALMMLCFVFMSKFQSVSLSISVLLQVVSVCGLLFLAFQLINSNENLKKKIASSGLLKTLYHFVFAIPGFVKFGVDHIYNDVHTTPQIVWAAALVEIVFVVIYIIIPLLKKQIYTTNLNSRSGQLTKSQVSAGISSGLAATDRKISDLKSFVALDWKKIKQEELFKRFPSNELELISYLKANNFKEKYEEKDDAMSMVSNFIFSHKMTLSAAKSYIQANTPLLIKYENEKQTLENTQKQNNDKKNDVFTSKILLREPIYTDKEKTIGSFENLKGSLSAYNYQYSLSGWVFLHEQPPSKSYSNNKFTSIINYGDKPNILFNPSKGTLQITNKKGENETEIIYQTKNILLQKWNNIVINYEGGTLDVFINGELVASRDNIIPYMSYDSVTTGSTDGVSGGVCSVIYYDGPLSKRQIEFFYNSLKTQNPPSV